MLGSQPDISSSPQPHSSTGSSLLAPLTSCCWKHSLKCFDCRFFTEDFLNQAEKKCRCYITHSSFNMLFKIANFGGLQLFYFRFVLLWWLQGFLSIWQEVRHCWGPDQPAALMLLSYESKWILMLWLQQKCEKERLRARWRDVMNLFSFENI